MGNIVYLLKDEANSVTGHKQPLDRGRQTCRGGYGTMPIQIYGITEGATVIFEATMSHEDIDNAILFNKEIWSPMKDGIYTQNIATSLSVPFAYIRIVLEIEQGAVGNNVTVTIDL